MGSASSVAVEECLGAGGICQDSEGDRAADVEGVVLVLGQVREGFGDGREGVVERRQVGPVGAGVHLGDAGVVDRAAVDRDVARVEGFELLQLTLLGVQPQHRLVHEPVEHDLADRPGLLDAFADLRST